MLRGYRIYIVALGLVLAGAQQPSKQTEANGGAKQQSAPASPTATPPPAPEPTYRPYPNYDPDPCYRAEHHDTADLCAQWRAAIAAEKAAHEARRATNWAIVATLLSVATIFGLIFSLYQTHGALGEARRGNRLNLLFEKRYRRESRKAAEDQERALDIAERNAEASAQQVQIADRAARLQLRAYLSVYGIELSTFNPPHLIRLLIRIKNLGATPAKIKQITRMAWVGFENTINPLTEGPDPIASVMFHPSLGRNQEDAIIHFVTGNDLTDLNTAGRDFIVYGRIDYEDIFGDAHWLTYAFSPTNYQLAVDSTFVPHVQGNDCD